MQAIAQKMWRAQIQRNPFELIQSIYFFIHFQVKVKHKSSVIQHIQEEEEEKKKQAAEWAKDNRDVNLFLSDLLAWPLFGKKKLRCVSTCALNVELCFLFCFVSFNFLINGFIHQLHFFLKKKENGQNIKWEKKKLCNALGGTRVIDTQVRNGKPFKRPARLLAATTRAARRTILALGAFSIYKTTNHEEE